MSGKPQIDGCRVVALGDAWAYGQGQITWNELEALAHAAPAEAQAQGGGEVVERIAIALHRAYNTMLVAPDFVDGWPGWQGATQEEREFFLRHAREAVSAPPSTPVGVEDDDGELVERVARAIATHGFGRPWDDFHELYVHDTDKSDLREYARAAIAALAQQPAAPRNSSGHCPDSSGHSRVESILLRAGFNPDEAARIAARAVQQGGPTR